MQPLTQSSKKMSALVEQARYVVKEIEDRLALLNAAEQKLKQITLSSKQAASMLNIGEGYFNNLKPLLKKKGYLANGVMYLEIQDIANWCSVKGHSFKNLPQK